jgi:hypothetical protein
MKMESDHYLIMCLGSSISNAIWFVFVRALKCFIAKPLINCGY